MAHRQHGPPIAVVLIGLVAVVLFTDPATSQATHHSLPAATNASESRSGTSINETPVNITSLAPSAAPTGAGLPSAPTPGTSSEPPPTLSQVPGPTQSPAPNSPNATAGSAAPPQPSAETAPASHANVTSNATGTRSVMLPPAESVAPPTPPVSPTPPASAPPPPAATGSAGYSASSAAVSTMMSVMAAAVAILAA